MIFPDILTKALPRFLSAEPYGFLLFSCVVIEITLNQDYRSTLITGTGCEVT